MRPSVCTALAVFLIALFVGSAKGATLVAHWSLNENTGTVANDSSPNALHGQLLGSPTLPAWTPGQFDSALQFAGINDRVQVAHDPALNVTTGYSISFWINAPPNPGAGLGEGGGEGDPRGVPLPANILDKTLQFNDNAGWQVGVGSGSSIFILTGTGSATPGASIPGVLNSTWHHVAITVALTPTLNIRGYVDGTQVTNFNNAATTLANNTRPLQFGGFFIGKLDEIRLYNGVLTTCEITGLADPLGFDDCNDTGIPDECELAGNDDNNNGVPDECDPPADCDNNGIPDNTEPLPPGVRCVDDDAAPGGNGLTWATPYKHLQDALAAAAASGGTITELWVAAGTYFPDLGLGQTPGDRERYFLLSSNLALYGGFACGDDDLSDRNPVANTTILSGDLLGNDGPDFANYEDNSYHVVVNGGGTNDTAVLDGFTISGGNANGPQGDPANHEIGGGIIIGNGSATIENCVIRANVAVSTSGSGIGGGGGIGIVEGGNPTIRNCVLENNRAGNGGASFARGSASGTFEDCMFRGNVANAIGGAVLHEAGSGVQTFSNCNFDTNSAAEGGAIFEAGGSPQFAACLFTENNASSGNGGAIILSGNGSGLFYRCSFFSNMSVLDGAALFTADAAALTAQSCLFTGNAAGGNGGAVDSNGTGLVILAQCTITGNHADGHSGAIYDGVGSGEMRVRRSIIWGNTADTPGTDQFLVEIPAQWSIAYSDVQGGWTGPDVGNIDADPLFVDVDGPDNLVGTIDDDLHLSPGSPCINTGDPAFVPAPGETDLDGQPRLLGGRVDMGAYESFPDCNSNDIPDELELDTDTDLVIDDCDNCPLIANPSQENADGDIPGDACDNCPNDPNKIDPGICGCGTADVDSDGDTILDCVDNCPSVPNMDQQNSDGDPVGDACDNCPAVTNTTQRNSDNDADGDACDLDDDNDGLPDDEDNCPRAANPGQEDTDADGNGDACDSIPEACCPADMNMDELLTAADIQDFVNALLSGTGCP